MGICGHRMEYGEGLGIEVVSRFWRKDVDRKILAEREMG